MSPTRSVVVLATASLVALQCKPLETEDLEVRTFELAYLEAPEAAALIEAYVYGQREEAPGGMSVTEKTLTVRERPENLARIAEVLARYDTPAPMVTLQFQLIEADGFQGVDAEIEEVERELRDLLRYRGYRLLASPMVQGTAGGTIYQHVSAGEAHFELTAEIQAVHTFEEYSTVQLEVSLEQRGYGALLQTKVSVRDGQSMVLGTGSPYGESGALILVVKPTVERG